MRHINRFAHLLFWCCFPVMPVYAYLDPGTGSIILQAIIASIAVGLFTIKSWWYRLVSLFKGKHSEDEKSEEDS